MANSFNPNPSVPQELVDAAKSGMLVVFVGAGISRMVGCPSWDGFADAVIKQLVPKVIDYHEKSLINAIADPRKRLSIAKILDDENGSKIDYKSIFDIQSSSGDIYEYINRFRCSFVTTNYDKLIKPEISNKSPEKAWRFFEREDLLAEKLDEGGMVAHLHGCFDSTKSMIITTKDYLEHYSSSEVPEFLKYLFSTKTVLFLGYGLDETEILEYILKSSDPGDRTKKNLFMLQGFFNAEMPLFEKLQKYYQTSFNAELIGFPKDHEDYGQQKEIIRKWSEDLTFGSVALVDELAAMEAELDD